MVRMCQSHRVCDWMFAGIAFTAVVMLRFLTIQQLRACVVRIVERGYAMRDRGQGECPIKHTPLDYKA
jgi:hypothetical protein